ncbi:serine hydrolase [Mycolicibacterium sp. XJ662]
MFGVWQRHSDGSGPSAQAAPATATVEAPLPAVPEPAVPLPPPADDVLAASFDAFASEVPADIGLAYASLGRPDQVTTLGAWSSGPAWSTIKVPLALALLRESGGGSVSSAMRSAITASDNAAAQSMWEQLGGGSAAASKVQEVLSAAGDPLTVVPSELRRPGFSIFGQTMWSLSDQARFLAHVACDPAAAPVTALMGDIVSGQQWGLGQIGGAYFKGGWGPGTDGLYLVRQYGVVPTATGQVAVAVAAVPDSGGFGDGTAVLNRIAGWAQSHLDEMGGGGCPVR